jgi:hypothetical protein
MQQLITTRYTGFEATLLLQKTPHMNIVSPTPKQVQYGLRGLPSRLWRKCNRLLRLGRPSGVVTLW